jgi:hypothetical protein
MEEISMSKRNDGIDEAINAALASAADSGAIIFTVGPPVPGRCWHDDTELEMKGFCCKPSGDPLGEWHQCSCCGRDYSFYDGEWHVLGGDHEHQTRRHD